MNYEIHTKRVRQIVFNNPVGRLALGALAMASVGGAISCNSGESEPSTQATQIAELQASATKTANELHALKSTIAAPTLTPKLTIAPPRPAGVPRPTSRPDQPTRVPTATMIPQTLTPEKHLADRWINEPKNPDLIRTREWNHLIEPGDYLVITAGPLSAQIFLDNSGNKIELNFPGGQGAERRGTILVIGGGAETKNVKLYGLVPGQIWQGTFRPPKETSTRDALNKLIVKETGNMQKSPNCGNGCEFVDRAAVDLGLGKTVIKETTQFPASLVLPNPTPDSPKKDPKFTTEYIDPNIDALYEIKPNTIVQGWALINGKPQGDDSNIVVFKGPVPSKHTPVMIPLSLLIRQFAESEEDLEEIVRQDIIRLKQKGKSGTVRIITYDFNGLQHEERRSY